jgi:hypothetical protein
MFLLPLSLLDLAPNCIANAHDSTYFKNYISLISMKATHAKEEYVVALFLGSTLRLWRCLRSRLLSSARFMAPTTKPLSLASWTEI